MIISSAPLRLSFNGGGSDLPAFTNRFMGKVVSVSIDRYVYVTVNKSYSNNFRIAYSRIETPTNIREINHPIVRACLEKYQIRDYLEITSVADIPSSGSGLGSSSAFTVALISALSRYTNTIKSQEQIAYEACEIEIDLCKEPIGMQDQYASAIGGLNLHTFNNNRVVVTEKVFTNQNESEKFISELNARISFFQIPFYRNTTQILRRQSEIIVKEADALDLTKKLVHLAEESVKSIREFDFAKLGNEMTLGWEIKSQLNGDSRSHFYQDLRSKITAKEILGGKLLGAGSGGFFAVLSEGISQNEVRDIFKGFDKVDFKVRDTHPETLTIGRSDYKY